MEKRQGYLLSQTKSACFGCEACTSVCHKEAIEMGEDDEGFRYPVIDADKCVDCGLCRRVCPYDNMPPKHNTEQFVYGGYAKDAVVRDCSTSGGLFTALAEAYCDENYVIFGADSKGLDVYHDSIFDKKEIDRFRKSKYYPSKIGSAYLDVKKFLQEGKKVLFSGTPCQIAALRNVLGKSTSTERLLTIEVVCEGFPSPLFIRKYAAYIQQKYHSTVVHLDYRYKDGARWDFQVMHLKLENGKEIKTDRWLSPFWIIWSRRLMSRPSCEACPFRTPNREADITLGDLWGVQKYCPELYGENRGATLTVCNTKKGKDVLVKAVKNLYGHELVYKDALAYQRPMRVLVPANPLRDAFMEDLKRMDYLPLCKKWCAKEPWNILWKKYVWGSNSQVVAWYKLKQRIKKYFNHGKSICY